MYKVKINYCGEFAEDKVFKTEMPKIPISGDMLGFWHGDTWIITTVDNIVYEFAEDGKYLLAEINVSY